jgi:hypothetical protein
MNKRDIKRHKYQLKTGYFIEKNYCIYRNDEGSIRATLVKVLNCKNQDEARKELNEFIYKQSNKKEK